MSPSPSDFVDVKRKVKYDWPGNPEVVIHSVRCSRPSDSDGRIITWKDVIVEAVADDGLTWEGTKPAKLEDWKFDS